MLGVVIKMGTDEYDEIIEEFFTKYGNFTKVTKDYYNTDGNGLGTVYGRCEDLMKEKEIREKIVELILAVDDEITDAKAHFTKTLTRDGYIK